MNVFKKHEFCRPLLSEIESIVDNCITDCNSNYYHTFRFTLEYNINFTNKRYNEIYNLTITNIPVGSYELNKNLKNARRNGSKFE